MSQYVDLGPALNHLLNRETYLGKVKGGLELPERSTRGGKMSIVVITGSPGSGKSTLALQMVIKAAKEGYDSLYLSLEDHPLAVQEKASHFGRSRPEPSVGECSWADFIYVPDELPHVEERQDEAVDRIRCVIHHARKKITKALQPVNPPGAVVAASLLPRPVDVSPKRARELFFQQYQYLETLVKAARTASEHFFPGDIKDLKSFATKLAKPPENDRFSQYLGSKLSHQTHQALAGYLVDQNLPLTKRLTKVLAEDFNRIIKGGEIYDRDRFDGVNLSPQTLELCASKPQEVGLISLNLRLIAEAYPDEIVTSLRVRIVVVDSLNMLSYTGQSRESLFRVFDLFRANGIMAIFTADGNLPIPFDSTMSDVVFSFSSKNDSAYLIKYISLEKSRYTPTAFGLHPYKITEREGIYVLPSLHSVVAATQAEDTLEESPPDKPKEQTSQHSDRIPFGWGDGLTKYVVRSAYRPAVVALHGPNRTRKSTIAANFLIHGLVGYDQKYPTDPSMVTPQEETGILILLKDSGETNEFDKIQSYPSMDHLRQARLKRCEDQGDPLLSALGTYQRGDKAEQRRKKAGIRVWGLDGSTAGAVLVVIHFNTGMLLPEEFVDIVVKAYDKLVEFKKNVRRVVLDDVSVIGAGSYPLLEESQTTADLFLSAFVHLMRNKKVDLMLVGTRSHLASGNQIVDRAIALADTVVETKIRDIFGDRYVLLLGDGEMAEDPSLQEWVPPALRIQPKNDGPSYMTFDRELLRGLTGFDGPEITRTKVYAYLYEENREIYRKYNDSLPYLVEPLCGLPSLTGESGLQVISYGPHISDTVHRSLESFRLQGADTAHLTRASVEKKADIVANKQLTIPPKQHTVLAMIDEFEPRYRDADGREVENAKAYTNNVLLIALRNDLFRDAQQKLNRNPDRPWNTWREMLTLVNEIKCEGDCVAPVWIDRSARETMSCCLVDCLISGWNAGPGSSHGMKADDYEHEAWKAILDGLRSPRQNNALINSLGDEVKAMHDMLNEAKKSRAWRSQSHPFAEDYFGSRSGKPQGADYRQMVKNGLPDDAALYICWYSQLRHLLVRRPDLAGVFRVAALPGGGVTGDWRLVVLAGSVSHRLGQEVVDTLTTLEEDYRRFSLGVGLPVGEDGKGKRWQNSGFRAWPGAHEDVTMDKLYAIHRHARRRSRIPNYVKIAPSLSVFAKRLAGDWQTKLMEMDEIVTYLGRLPEHFDVLVNPYPKEKPGNHPG